MRNLFALFFFLVGINSSFSQQNPISNFYQFNEYLLNPAEAGNQNKFEGTLSHRLQWRGIEGAPETSFLGIHSALNKNMGIGARLIMDKSDILQQFSGAISYAYRYAFTEFKRIHIGVSALGMQNNIRFGNIKITDQSDEVANSGDVEGFTFDAEAGITLELNRLRIGLSSAHLFESGVDFELISGNGTFNRARLFSSYFSYLYDLNSDWKIEPMIMLRSQKVESFQFELNALFSWQEKFYLGAGYRDQAGYIAKAGFQITNHFLVAYAYEFSNSGIASYSSGSHEFMLGYRLKQSKKKEPQIVEDLVPYSVTEKDTVSIEQTELSELIQDEDKQGKVQPKEEINELTEDTETKEVLETLEPTTIDDTLALVRSTTKGQETVESEMKVTTIPLVFDEIIYFQFNKSKLSDEGKQELQKIIRKLNKFPNAELTITGHTCNLGDETINKTISLARANSVKSYLISGGIQTDRLTVIPMLDQKPAELNDSFEHRKKNRRVEFDLKTDK